MTEMHPAPVGFIVAIVDRGKGERVAELFNGQRPGFHFAMLGNGTASSEVMDCLGLDQPEKTVVMSLASQEEAGGLIRFLSQRMSFTEPGRGIAFFLPVDGISASVCREEWKEGVTKVQKEAIPMENKPFELIAAVLASGQVDAAMEAARAAGATGGTVVRARGLSAGEVTHFLHITLQPEKELLFILAPTAEKRAIMQAISEATARGQELPGVVFSFPVSHVAGLTAALQPDA